MYIDCNLQQKVSLTKPECNIGSGPEVAPTLSQQIPLNLLQAMSYLTFQVKVSRNPNPLLPSMHYNIISHWTFPSQDCLLRIQKKYLLFPAVGTSTVMTITGTSAITNKGINS